MTDPIDVRGVRVSNPDKVFFPESGITKGEIAEYYGRIADTMLPHVRGRCVSMHRWPDGIAGGDFYQKEAPEHFPGWIRTETVPRKGGWIGSPRRGGRRRDAGLPRRPAVSDAARVAVQGGLARDPRPDGDRPGRR